MRLVQVLINLILMDIKKTCAVYAAPITLILLSEVILSYITTCLPLIFLVLKFLKFSSWNIQHILIIFQVETRTLEEVHEVLRYATQNKTSLTRMMLDNMVVPLPSGDVDVSMLKEAVGIINGRFETEVMFIISIVCSTKFGWLNRLLYQKVDKSWLMVNLMFN